MVQIGIIVKEKKHLKNIENITLTKAHGRYNFIKELSDDNTIKKSDSIHLLGCNVPQEFSWYKDMPFIKTIDTSNPVIHGLSGIKYNDWGLDEKNIYQGR